MKKQIIVPAAKHVRGQPLQRCLYEIGIGNNCKKRAHDHQFVSRSNDLFRLVVSVVHRRFPSTFDIKAYQLHRYLEAGDQSISEMMLILLGRGLSTECGLNVRHGGALDTKMAQLPQILFDRLLQTLTNLNMFELSWEHDREKRKAFSAAIDAVIALPKLEQEATALEADGQAKAVEIMATVFRCVDAQEARSAVLDSIQEWRDSHPRQEVLCQETPERVVLDEGNIKSFISDDESHKAFTAASTPSADDDSGRPCK